MKKSAWLRLALILVCAAMMLSLFACGGEETVETEGSSKKPETEATEKQTESEKTEESKTETETETETETNAPQVDTTETETKEATTEKKVDTTETEKKPVETTTEKPTKPEDTEKETEPAVEPDPLKVYIGPDKLAAASVNATRLDKGVVSADGSYATYKNKADGGDGYVQVYGGGAVVSGQYLVIKYRYPTSNQTTATNIEIFSSTVNGGPAGGDNTRMPVKADGEWHLAVVDMAACKGEEKFPAGADGKYIVKYARFDVLDGSHKVGDSVDVAYAGITDDPTEVIALARKEGVKTIDFTAASNKSETYYSSTGTTTPTPADIANVFIGPEQLASASVNTGRISGKEVSKDGSYATFTANGTGGDGYALVFSGGAEVSGQYLIIKYRYPTTSKQTYIEIFASCTNAGPTGGDNIRFNVTPDGEWHVQVVDFADFNSKFTANEDGTYTVKYARVDLLDSNSTAEGETVDIAYVAFADDYQNVLKANGDCKAVDYRLGAEEIYSLYTSTGTTLPAMTDVANKYFDAEYLAGKAPAGTNIGNVVLSEDKSYVSIYGKGAGDGYFVVMSGNTDVTGQYLIMKYRYPATNAEGYAPKARPLFAGNVMNGPTGKDTTGSFPVVADGEWHMTVFNIAAHITEEWFAPAEDGTYALKYLRFDIADGMPEDCCIDIQYIALTDDVNNLLPVAKGEGLYTVEARLTADGTVVYYPDTNSTEPPEVETESGAESEEVTEIETETESETQTEGEIVEINPDEDQGDVDYEVPFFQFCIDFINDIRTAGRSGANAMYKEFAPYSTSIDGIIDLKGWFFGMSGVASYEYSIDGGATWIAIPDTATDYAYGSDPDGIDVLIIDNNTQLLGTPGFGVNANFRAGASLKIDLSDLHDESVSVTVSAVLNSGDRVEFLKLLDVFAACTHEDNTSAWNTVEGDIQKESSDCSACGKSVVRYKTVTDDGLILFNPEVIADKISASNNPTLVVDPTTGMSYVRITAAKTTGEETVHLISGTEAHTNIGKYVAVLYRTSATEQIQVYYEGKHTGVVAGGTFFTTTNGGDTWYFDVATTSTFSGVDGNGVEYEYDGSKLTAFRLDYFNTARPEGATADIAYVAFFDTEDDAIAFYRNYVDAYLGAENCDHLDDGVWVSSTVAGKVCTHCKICESELNARACDHPDISKLSDFAIVADKKVTYSAKCALCGGTGEFNNINQEGLRVITPSEMNDFAIAANRFTHTVETDPTANNMPYYHATATIASEGYFFINNGSTNLMGVGKYVAVLYRKDVKATEGNNVMQLWINSAGKVNHVGATSPSFNHINVGYEWDLLIYDFSAAASLVPADGYGWTRLDFFDGPITVGDVTDIAYIGFFNSKGAAQAYYAEYAKQYLGEANCKHALDAFVEDGNGYKTATCAYCGVEIAEHADVTDEGMKIYNPSAFTGTTHNGNFHGRYAVTANGMPYYRFTVKQAKSEATYTLNAGTEDIVTGDYMAVLYRKNAANANYGIQIYNSPAGSTSPSTNSEDNTLNINGEWDLLVLKNKNTDTSKSGWTRIDMINGTSALLGESVDIAYVGFFSTPEKAYEYYNNYKTEYNLSNCADQFTINFDASNTKLNGTAYIASTSKQDAPIDIDYTSATLNDAKSVTVGGWCVTPGGCANFSYYVIDSTTGTAVKSDRKLLIVGANNDGDIMKMGTNRNFGESCGLGASTGGARVIDLTGYEGKTVSVQVVVCTNYGPEIVVSNLTNITVPAAE